MSVVQPLIPVIAPKVFKTLQLIISKITYEEGLRLVVNRTTGVYERL